MFNFDVFYRFRTREFKFRKTVVYAVMLWYNKTCKVPFCLLSWLHWNNPTRTTDSHLQIVMSTSCIHTVVTPDDGPSYAKNM